MAENDELERITSELKEHEQAIDELQSAGDPAERDRLAELERRRLGLLARLRAMGSSETNGDA
jgi:transcription elongation GreA/GreB family factor